MAGCEPTELHDVLDVQLFCFWSSVISSDSLKDTVLSTTAFFNAYQWGSVIKVALHKPKAKDMKEGQGCPLGPPSCNFCKDESQLSHILLHCFLHCPSYVFFFLINLLKSRSFQPWRYWPSLFKVSHLLKNSRAAFLCSVTDDKCLLPPFHS